MGLICFLSEVDDTVDEIRWVIWLAGQRCLVGVRKVRRTFSGQATHPAWKSGSLTPYKTDVCMKEYFHEIHWSMEMDLTSSVSAYKNLAFILSSCRQVWVYSSHKFRFADRKTLNLLKSWPRLSTDLILFVMFVKTRNEGDLSAYGEMQQFGGNLNRFLKV